MYFEPTNFERIEAYILGPTLLLAAALFLVGAWRIAMTRSVTVTWRWPMSEPARTRDDLKRWHVQKEQGWANIWPAILGYLLLGVPSLHYSVSSMWSFFKRYQLFWDSIWILPGIAIAVGVFFWLQSTKR